LPALGDLGDAFLRIKKKLDGAKIANRKCYV
jgi:hypothetical protein